MMERDEIESIIAGKVRDQGTAEVTAAILSLASLAFAYLTDDDRAAGFTAYVNENTSNPDVTPEEMQIQLAMQGIIAMGAGRTADVTEDDGDAALRMVLSLLN